MDETADTAPDNIPGLIEGRIAHYVLEDGHCKGEHRPAVIVKVWNANRTYGMVNMQVFTDGTNDGFKEKHYAPVGDKHVEFTFDQHMLWRTSVHYSEDKEPGTWHWIERA